MNKENFSNEEREFDIEGIISSKEERIDKNGRKYLIVSLEGTTSLFVFPNFIRENEWDSLREGDNYHFVVKKGNKDSNILKRFNILEEK